MEEEPYLRRYIEDGRLQIDHNRAELKQQNQVISISATVNLHGGCFDGYRKEAYYSLLHKILGTLVTKVKYQAPVKYNEGGLVAC